MRIRFSGPMIDGGLKDGVGSVRRGKFGRRSTRPVLETLNLQL